jgi:hypothetical protein
MKIALEVGGKTHHFHLHRKCPVLHTSDVRLGTLCFRSSAAWRLAAADYPHRMLKCKLFHLRKRSSQPLLAEKFLIFSRDVIALAFS